MKKLRIPPGLDIAYVEYGSGPVLVQVHGLGGQSVNGESRNFKYTTPFLKESFTVVNFDLPGGGQSDPSPDGDGALALAEHACTFVSEYADRPVFLHGTSFGGNVVMAMAGRHPELFSRVVISVSMPRQDKAALARRKLWQAVIELNRPDIYSQVVAETGYAREFYERPDAEDMLAEYEAYITAQLKAAVKNPATERIGSLIETDFMQFADAIKVPTLCIAGAEDHMTPHTPAASGAGLKAFSERLPDSEFQIIDGAGHYVHFEKPEELARVITEFLSR
jgi:pimeloyl-ACP methyl ester carboxylesterase